MTRIALSRIPTPARPRPRRLTRHRAIPLRTIHLLRRPRCQPGPRTRKQRTARAIILTQIKVHDAPELIRVGAVQVRLCAERVPGCGTQIVDLDDDRGPDRMAVVGVGRRVQAPAGAADGAGASAGGGAVEILGHGGGEAGLRVVLADRM